MLLQILETAPTLVVSQLLDFVYNGFLLPVLIPALFQVFLGPVERSELGLWNSIDQRDIIFLSQSISRATSTDE